MCHLCQHQHYKTVLLTKLSNTQITIRDGQAVVFEQTVQQFVFKIPVAPESSHRHSKMHPVGDILDSLFGIQRQQTEMPQSKELPENVAPIYIPTDDEGRTEAQQIAVLKQNAPKGSMVTVEKTLNPNVKVLVMSRVHDQDSVGQLLPSQSWEHLALPLALPAKFEKADVQKEASPPPSIPNRYGMLLSFDLAYDPTKELEEKNHDLENSMAVTQAKLELANNALEIIRRISDDQTVVGLSAKVLATNKD